MKDKKEIFNHTIRVPMPKELKEKFQDACHWNRTTMSEEIRKFIKTYQRED